MKNDKIVIINGQQYDNTTGLPVPKSGASSPKTITEGLSDIRTVHSISQKSHKPQIKIANKPADQNTAIRRRIGRSMDVSRSNKISHFAPRPAPIRQIPAPKRPMDIGPIKHPIASKVAQTRSINKPVSTKPAEPKTSKAIKEEAIAKALNQPRPAGPKHKPSHRNKLISIFGISVILLAVAGYLTYLNMPSFSVRIASAQAGIDATYPEYRPNGFSINGPISYKDGEVSIHFHANTGSSEFTIQQSKSSWDSSALKNKVNSDSKGEFITTEINGLTIFSYDDNAAWINGGIMYEITGNAPLSNDQIQHIATSL